MIDSAGAGRRRNRPPRSSSVSSRCRTRPGRRPSQPRRARARRRSCRRGRCAGPAAGACVPTAGHRGPAVWPGGARRGHQEGHQRGDETRNRPREFGAGRGRRRGPGGAIEQARGDHVAAPEPGCLLDHRRRQPRQPGECHGQADQHERGAEHERSGAARLLVLVLARSLFGDGRSQPQEDPAGGAQHSDAGQDRGDAQQDREPAEAGALELMVDQASARVPDFARQSGEREAAVTNSRPVHGRPRPRPRSSPSSIASLRRSALKGSRRRRRQSP